MDSTLGCAQCVQAQVLTSHFRVVRDAAARLLAAGHCLNRFESIGGASYFALINMFGEFPLISEHSSWGMVMRWGAQPLCFVLNLMAFGGKSEVRGWRYARFPYFLHGAQIPCGGSVGFEKPVHRTAIRGQNAVFCLASAQRSTTEKE